MKNLISLLLLVLIQFSVNAQTRRMTNVEAGRTYSIENQGTTVQPLLQKAEQQFRAFDFEETFLTLENAVAQNPNSAEALLLRARFKKIIGMEAEAAEDLRLASRVNPYVVNLFGYYGNDGLLNILSIEPEQAIHELSNFQKLNYYYQALDEKLVEDGDKEIELQGLGQVIEAMELDQLDEALEAVNDIIKRFPNSAIAYDIQGVILEEQDKLDEALNAFFKAIELEPDFAMAWYNLGRIERSLQHFKKAKSYLDRSIDLQSDLVKAYFERAMLFKQIGAVDKALQDYNTIIDLGGNTYMEALLNRGLTKKILGDYGGALADLDQVINDFPNNAELRKNRGNLYLLFGLHLKAIDDYTQAIKLNSSYAEAYYNRGLAFFLIYDKISGCADLERSKKLGYEKARETSIYFCTE